MKVQKLLDLMSNHSYEANYAIAKATRTCVICRNAARVFRDASAKLEYDVSALCQGCQDEYFKIG
ncbi:MAG: hypothetical protein ABII06_16325 [Pseudomonadota bacterium]